MRMIPIRNTIMSLPYFSEERFQLLSTTQLTLHSTTTIACSLQWSLTGVYLLSVVGTATLTFLPSWPTRQATRTKKSTSRVFTLTRHTQGRSQTLNTFPSGPCPQMESVRRAAFSLALSAHGGRLGARATTQTSIHMMLRVTTMLLRRHRAQEPALVHQQAQEALPRPQRRSLLLPT